MAAPHSAYCYSVNYKCVCRFHIAVTVHFTNSVYFTPTNAHVKPLLCSFYCKMYPYTCFDPRISVRGFFLKATITSTAYFEGSNSTHVLIFVVKFRYFKTNIKT
jgi:hypothetical protein